MIPDFSELEKPDELLENLLIGNGFSIWLSKKFEYKSLLNQCEGLLPQDMKLFEMLKTSNFETCLKILNDTIAVNSFYNIKDNHIRNYERIKISLIETVGEIHNDLSEISEYRKDAAKLLFRKAIKIFTTNYDLLPYRIILSLNDEQCKERFGDSFNLDTENIISGLYFSRNFEAKTFKTIHYLHGALHLYEEDGITKKITQKKSDNLLDALRKNMDKGFIPLFVSEGKWELKRKAIESSPYLKFCYDRLQAIKGSLTVFGHNLDRQTDRHIIDAINKSEVKKIVYGIYKINGEDELESEMKRIKNAFKDKEVVFYKSESIFRFAIGWKGFGIPKHEFFE